MSRIPLALLAFSFAASPACADVYKCSTPRGGVTYQDQPCATGAVENRMQIIDDRAWNPAPSADMKQAAEELRKKGEELTARLDKEREERRLREAEQPPPHYGPGSRFQPPVAAAAEPYGAGAGVWRAGYYYAPQPYSYPYPASPVALLPHGNGLHPAPWFSGSPGWDWQRGHFRNHAHSHSRHDHSTSFQDFSLRLDIGNVRSSGFSLRARSATHHVR